MSVNVYSNGTLIPIAGNGGGGGGETEEYVSVTADGVKSCKTLLDELSALIDLSKATFKSYFADISSIQTEFYKISKIQPPDRIVLDYALSNGTTMIDKTVWLRKNNQSTKAKTSASSSSITTSTEDSLVPDSGTIYKFVY